MEHGTIIVQSKVFTQIYSISVEARRCIPLKYAILEMSVNASLRPAHDRCTTRIDGGNRGDETISSRAGGGTGGPVYECDVLSKQNISKLLSDDVINALQILDN